MVGKWRWRYGFEIVNKSFGLGQTGMTFQAEVMAQVKALGGEKSLALSHSQMNENKVCEWQKSKHVVR